MEEFWGLAFEGVADELENPSDREKCRGVKPEAMVEETSDEDPDGNQNRRNTERVAGAIDGMLVAARVLRDPLFTGAVA